MTDVIRKAVELADGWKLTETSFYAPLIGYCYFPDKTEDISKVALDALAAQLVRQCDKKLKDWRCLELFEGHTAVRKFEPLSDKGVDIAACYGKGRTMNTIIAIVESGVLE